MVYPYSGNLHGEIQGMNHQFLPDTALGTMEIGNIAFHASLVPPNPIVLIGQILGMNHKFLPAGTSHYNDFWYLNQKAWWLQ